MRSEPQPCLLKGMFRILSWLPARHTLQRDSQQALSVTGIVFSNREPNWEEKGLKMV